MLDLTLEEDFNKPRSSSSYFDFVEKKIEDKNLAHTCDTTDSARTGKDAFVVRVMDQETTNQLKLQYFNGYTFPK